MAVISANNPVKAKNMPQYNQLFLRDYYKERLLSCLNINSLCLNHDR